MVVRWSGSLGDARRLRCSGWAHRFPFLMRGANSDQGCLLLFCFLCGIWLSVERQSSSHKLRHGWRADSPVGACLYGRAGDIWPRLPRWPRTTTRVVAAVCPRFRSMPAGTAAANLPQYLASTLPLANTPVRTSCQPHPVLLPTHSIHTSTILLPCLYFTAAATSHQAAFPPATAGFTCTAISNPAASCHHHTGMPPNWPKSNPTIHVDSCATFVGRPVRGARPGQSDGGVAHSASQAQEG